MAKNLAEDAAERRTRSDGDRTRRSILDTAVRLATVEGLERLSIGRLAEEAGVSKSGLFAHFRSKEKLQLATIEAAREIFVREIIMPAEAASGPRERVEQLCERFLSYVERLVFPGGCFFAVAAAEVGARPGPVRERIAKYQRQWMQLLEHNIAEAQAIGALDDAPASQVAFECNALLIAANTAFILHGDRTALERARRAIQVRLRPPSELR
ncbi:MAG TPA: TetR/AcrR family transcriptional regulator [Verrucomicrobiae bacterium]|nr:TetR/AcrR family transcriptional regulator [Verrucomicrobiae bacterium]HTZ54702.1 TetR/AcrR family transcriptional regulator [Candidatus Acidoferrum sp.]